MPQQVFTLGESIVTVPTEKNFDTLRISGVFRSDMVSQCSLGDQKFATLIT